MAKTVRVKVAVAVDNEGNWIGRGAAWKSEADAADEVCDVMGPAGKVMIHFVEAELPIPEETNDGR